MDTQHMLDNAATASQARQLLEPVTRGAVLRSMVQWINAQRCTDTTGDLVDALEQDPEYNL